MQWIISPITKNASNLTQSCMHQCTIRKRHETDECSVDCYLTDILAHEWTQGFLDRIWFGFEQTERLLYNPGLVLISPAALHCLGCVTGLRCVTVCSTWRSPRRAIQTKQRLCSALCGGMEEREELTCPNVCVCVCLCVAQGMTVLERLLA